MFLARCTNEIRHKIDGSPVPPRILRERGVPGDLTRPSPIWIRDQENRSLALCDGYQGCPGKKRDQRAMMAIKG